MMATTAEAMLQPRWACSRPAIAEPMPKTPTMISSQPRKTPKARPVKKGKTIARAPSTIRPIASMVSQFDFATSEGMGVSSEASQTNAVVAQGFNHGVAAGNERVQRPPNRLILRRSARSGEPRRTHFAAAASFEARCAGASG